MADASGEEPKTPHNEGTLRGSAGVYLNGVLKHKAPVDPKDTEAKPDPAEESPTRPGADEIIVEVGFNQPYAAAQHEREDFEHSEEFTGAKYLETPMSANRDRYQGVVAKEVKGTLGKP